MSCRRRRCGWRKHNSRRERRVLEEESEEESNGSESVCFYFSVLLIGGFKIGNRNLVPKSKSEVRSPHFLMWTSAEMKMKMKSMMIMKMKSMMRMKMIMMMIYDICEVIRELSEVVLPVPSSCRWVYFSEEDR